MVALPHGTLDATRPLRAPVQPSERSRGGRGDGPVLVAYTDFDCPGCKTFRERWLSIDADVREGVRYVHRHFPMVISHPRAMQSALALEAAGDQDAFWPMYDLLLAGQTDREIGAIYHYAEQLDLDMDRFRADVRGRRHAPKVWTDVQSGKASGVEGTPGLFLDSLAYHAPGDAGRFEADLRAVLEG